MSEGKTIKEVGELLASVFGDDMTAIQQAGGFTCGEADNIATALLLCDQPAAARMWLFGHVLNDTDGPHGEEGDEDYEEGDVHWVEDTSDQDAVEEMAKSHVRYLAAVNGVALTDELDVPDDLANEPPLNSVRTGASNIRPQQHIKVWAFTVEDPWPEGTAGWQWGTVAEVEDMADELGIEHDIPRLLITFTNGQKVVAVRTAVTYIVQEG